MTAHKGVIAKFKMIQIQAFIVIEQLYNELKCNSSQWYKETITVKRKQRWRIYKMMLREADPGYNGLN